ncbi:hypothetical protein [Kibdelosporangium aridum]|uniref:hypothetical protein n=1 Tax=Kibdelosporangium aridum TaxID=2030 RepID=UPI00135A1159|nr:hypothetical protein [Kibdelosporangium aridum]
MLTRQQEVFAFDDWVLHRGSEAAPVGDWTAAVMPFVRWPVAPRDHLSTMKPR